MSLAWARSTEVTVASSQVTGVLGNFLARDELFAGLYILGCVNGLMGRTMLAFQSGGWMGAALAINVFVLFACFAGVSIVLSEDRDRIRPSDLVVGAMFLMCVSLPIFALSWIAVTGLSLYLLFHAKGGSARCRGAVILLALTVPMLWSRLLFQFFAKPILLLDAGLASLLLGTERVGNLVQFADGSGYMLVMPACSSLTNMSLAFLCWVTVTQWVKHRWSPMDILWSGVACASVVAVNVIRISLTGLSRSHYEAIHSAWGGEIFNYLIIAVTVGFSVLGARRELFSRA
jgi:exosortase/archaeosortase family protein